MAGTARPQPEFYTAFLEAECRWRSDAERMVFGGAAESIGFRPVSRVFNSEAYAMSGTDPGLAHGHRAARCGTTG
eukprot:1511953-Rhodomonas_salina.2